MELHHHEFEFETVTVDSHGNVVARETRVACQFIEPLGDGVTLEMIAIPGGAFLMGSPMGRGFDDEHPQREVTVAPFHLGKHPVTQGQWEAVMGGRPLCRFKGSRRPVDNVSWCAAHDFCEQLSKRTGRVYRVPSEAQWEYACRAGSVTPFYVGETLTTNLANYVGEHTYLSEPKGVYRHHTTEVGSFPPNAFGLYDMHGNVWEWCADPWHEGYEGAPADGSVWESAGSASHRVLRGGSWHDPPDLCRCAVRLQFKPDDWEDYTGFRVGLALPAGVRP